MFFVAVVNGIFFSCSVFWLIFGNILKGFFYIYLKSELFILHNYELIFVEFVDI